MAIEVWTVGEFLQKVRDHASKEFDPADDAARKDWLTQVIALGERAHARGDGVAIYENLDLGHPDIGQWQIASYGGDNAQLETREDYGQPEEELRSPDYFTYGQDTLRTTLPDIGGRINWRYTLKAIVPSYEQQAREDGVEEKTYRIVRFYRDNREKEVQETGLTLEEAQAHCKREDTHDHVDGWFDGYEEE